jgi:hypothetical protein
MTDNLGKDLIENTSPKNSSIIVCLVVAPEVLIEPLPRNGQFLNIHVTIYTCSKHERSSQRNSHCQQTSLKQNSFLGNGCETKERRPLLGNRFLISKNRRSLLGNDSANTFPLQWIRKQQRNDVLYVVLAKIL